MEQEKIDKLMIEMDGTENKCKWSKRVLAGKVVASPGIVQPFGERLHSP